MDEEVVSRCTRADITYADGKTLLMNVPLEDMMYDTVRNACRALGCTGFSNKTRVEMIAAIEKVRGNRSSQSQAYARDGAALLGQSIANGDFWCEEEADRMQRAEEEGLETGTDDSWRTAKPKPPRQKVDIHSIFRAIGTFFHPSMQEGLACLGNQWTREQLDRYHAGDAPDFFHDASKLYNDPSVASLRTLQVEHPAFVGKHIEPSRFESMDAKGLKGVWDRVVKAYREIREKMTSTGNHATFDVVAKGRLDALYLYLLLQEHPNLIDKVHTELPNGASAESSAVHNTLRFASASVAAAAAAERTKDSAGGGGGKRKTEVNAMLTAMTKLAKVVPNGEEPGEGHSSQRLALEERRIELLQQKLSFEQQRVGAEVQTAGLAQQAAQLQLWQNANGLLAAEVSKAEAATSQAQQLIHTHAANRLATYCDGLMNSMMGAGSTVAGVGLPSPLTAGAGVVEGVPPPGGNTSSVAGVGLPNPSTAGAGVVDGVPPPGGNTASPDAAF
eukprot:GHVU01164997.1.p1 GENE.GHVU01164997.1~~GHVU01164997.1.p1  ORF type:complete len:503 (-),score=73.17 GHVU01164997.1:141-1649(-)